MCPLSIDRPNIWLRRYAPDDELRLVLRDDFAAERAAVLACDAGPLGGKGRVTWTALADKRPIGVGGVVDAGEGDWQCWAWLADVDRRAMARLVRLAGSCCWWLMSEPQVKRLIAHARADFPAARACLQKIGFTVTGETLEASTGVYDVMERIA